MAISFIFIDSHEKNNLKTNKVAAINLHNRMYKGVNSTKTENIVKPVKNESLEIETDRPLFYRRGEETTLPGSPDLKGLIGFKNETKSIKKDSQKNSNKESIKNDDPDFNLMAGLQKDVEMEEDEYLRTPLNPMTEFYFISAFRYYMPFYSRFSRLTLMIVSVLTQAFLVGVLILLWESGVSESATYSISEIFVRLDALHIIYALSTPVISNLFVGGLGWLLIKRRLKIRTDLAEAEKQENCNRKLRLLGYLICVCIIGFIVLATYFIVFQIDGNSSMIWMSMILIGLIFDVGFVQVTKVIVAWLLTRNKNKDHL